MNQHSSPAWLKADRPSSIFTKGKYLMSLISKLTARKPAVDSISPLARFEAGLDKVIGEALARGLHINTLESREKSARFRLAAGLRF